MKEQAPSQIFKPEKGDALAIPPSLPSAINHDLGIEFLSDDDESEMAGTDHEQDSNNLIQFQTQDLEITSFDNDTEERLAENHCDHQNG